MEKTEKKGESLAVGAIDRKKWISWVFEWGGRRSMTVNRIERREEVSV